MLAIVVLGLLMTSCYREDGEFSTLPLPDGEDEEIVINDGFSVYDVQMTLQTPEIIDGRVKLVGAIVNNPTDKELVYGFMWFDESNPVNVSKKEVGTSAEELIYFAELEGIPADDDYVACVFVLDQETGETAAAGEITFTIPKREVDK